MAVHVDHAGPDSPGSRQCQLQELLGGTKSRLGDNMKIDGVSGRVDSAVQVHPVSRDANIRLIEPARIDWDAADPGEAVDSEWAHSAALGAKW